MWSAQYKWLSWRIAQQLASNMFYWWQSCCSWHSGQGIQFIKQFLFPLICVHLMGTDSTVASNELTWQLRHLETAPSLFAVMDSKSYLLHSSFLWKCVPSLWLSAILMRQHFSLWRSKVILRIRSTNFTESRLSYELINRVASSYSLQLR